MIKIIMITLLLLIFSMLGIVFYMEIKNYIYNRKIIDEENKRFKIKKNR